MTLTKTILHYIYRIPKINELKQISPAVACKKMAETVKKEVKFPIFALWHGEFNTRW